MLASLHEAPFKVRGGGVEHGLYGGGIHFSQLNSSIKRCTMFPCFNLIQYIIDRGGYGSAGRTGSKTQASKGGDPCHEGWDSNCNHIELFWTGLSETRSGILAGEFHHSEPDPSD